MLYTHYSFLDGGTAPHSVMCKPIHGLYATRRLVRIGLEGLCML